MSIHRLSAGSGYRYLLRSVATADTAPQTPGAGLSAYYAATGTPPGRWYGTGLAGLGGAGQVIRAGQVVTESELAALYGSGSDPLTGQRLGAGYRVYASVEQRIARRIAVLPADLDQAGRAVAVAEIRRAEEARPVPQAVAGFDLTFTATKSVSTLWALADPATRQIVEAAHHAAVADTLGYLEQHACYTRTGHNGVEQVRARGFFVAAFDHPDTRTGDPNLHTHAVVANRVQGPDGAWRSLDSRALHHAAVAASELYDSLLADQLVRRLPVGFAWRSRGERRSPAYELDGIDDDLLGLFSTRSVDIAAALATALQSFRERTGREPTRPEVLKLRQQATLATRPDKEHHALADQLTAWQARAGAATGESAETIAARVLTQGTVGKVWRHDEIDDNDLSMLTAQVLAGCAARRSTWTVANIHAEIQRATRDLHLASTGDRYALTDTLTRRVVATCTPLFDTGNSPTRPQRSGLGVPHVQERRWSHRDLLVAELRLFEAATTASAMAPGLNESYVREAAAAPRHGDRGEVFTLAQDQVEAVVGVATGPASVQVLVGPAGTGKTTTMQVLAGAWSAAYGAGSVLGLAPSAIAADALAQALRIECETTAKWIHETGKPTPAAEWQLRAGQLVIVDEASLAGTRTLDVLAGQAGAAGAKLLLVGDHAQLDAIDAGGAFGLLARHSPAHQLVSLWRFRHRWEAHTTRALRAGQPESLDAYQQHHRLHSGPAETMLDAAYTAWADDTGAGGRSLLVAADSATVYALNARAHNDRVLAGTVTGPTIALGDTSTGGERGRVGVGDLVLTRRNDRTLTYPGGHVRNGQHWRITALHASGAMSLTPAEGSTAARITAVVPAAYVRQHLDPGYAVTIHRAQGTTVDTAHLLAAPGLGRRGLYVGMTRGRDANHLYLATDQLDTCEHTNAEPVQTMHGVLTAILADDRTELSALETHAGQVGWARALTEARCAVGAGAGATAARQPEPGQWDPSLMDTDPDVQSIDWSLSR